MADWEREGLWHAQYQQSMWFTDRNPACKNHITSSTCNFFMLQLWNSPPAWYRLSSCEFLYQRWDFTNNNICFIFPSCYTLHRKENFPCLCHDDIQSIQDARNVTQDRQEEADPKLQLQRDEEQKTQSKQLRYGYKCTYSQIWWAGLSFWSTAMNGTGLTPQSYLRNTPRGGKRMAIRTSQKVAPDFPFPICAMDLCFPPKTTNSKPNSFRRSFRKSSKEKTKEKRSGCWTKENWVLRKNNWCWKTRNGCFKSCKMRALSRTHSTNSNNCNREVQYPRAFDVAPATVRVSWSTANISFPNHRTVQRTPRDDELRPGSSDCVSPVWGGGWRRTHHGRARSSCLHLTDEMVTAWNIRRIRSTYSGERHLTVSLDNPWRQHSHDVWWANTCQVNWTNRCELRAIWWDGFLIMEKKTIVWKGPKVTDHEESFWKVLSAIISIIKFTQFPHRP